MPDAWWPQAGLVVEVDSRQIRTEPDLVVAAIRAALQAGSPVPALTTRPPPPSQARARALWVSRC
ncbi:MAG: hypothetical protein ACRDRJ_36225 [Streptosporangiaceae bacterium]